MVIQRRTVQKWVNLAKFLFDVKHLLAELHFSRLKVPGTSALLKARRQTNSFRQHYNHKCPQAVANV
jgi:hypothetical protein